MQTLSLKYCAKEWLKPEGVGGGNGNPLQYSCLENPMDGGAWWATVHGVAESQIWLSDFKKKKKNTKQNLRVEQNWEQKMLQPVHPKDQSWIFTGRTDAEAETPILWPPDVKNWLIGKDPDAGKDWRQEEKGMTEDEMVGWHHRRNGHGFE